MYLTHENIIFDILESHAFQKYSTCWVLSLSLSLQNLKNLKNLKKWIALRCAAAADLYQTMITTRAPDGANKWDRTEYGKKYDGDANKVIEPR